MENLFGRCISSPVFTFLVGPEKKEVSVHSYAFAELSGTLNSLLNGGMIEAKTRVIDWSDVDLDTFARFCEFAYLRDYSLPSQGPVAVWSPVVEGTAVVETPSVAAIAESSKLQAMRRLFEDSDDADELPTLQQFISTPDFDEILDCETLRAMKTRWVKGVFSENLVISPRHSHRHSYRDIKSPTGTRSHADLSLSFMKHARLYVLADKYGIEDLRWLVLSKLFKTSEEIKFCEKEVAGVIEFVRFVYSNTPPNSMGTIDPMRNLAVRYVVSHLEQIGQHKALQWLLEEGGSFVVDFWKIFWNVKPSPTLDPGVTGWDTVVPTKGN